MTLAAARSYKAVTSVRRRYPYPLQMSALHVSPRSWHSAGQAGQPNPEGISWPGETLKSCLWYRLEGPQPAGRFLCAKARPRYLSICTRRQPTTSCAAIPHRVAARRPGQARRAHGSCISIQCIRLLSLTPRRPFYRERWARQCATCRHVQARALYPGEENIGVPEAALGAGGWRPWAPGADPTCSHSTVSG